MRSFSNNSDDDIMSSNNTTNNNGGTNNTVEENGICGAGGELVLDDGGGEGGGGGGGVLCVAWCGTSGLGGHLLGTDEENVVFMNFVIYHVARDEVMDEHSFYVQPPSTSLNSHSGSDGGEGADSPTAPPIQLSEMCRRDYQLTEEELRGSGVPLETVLRKMEDVFDRITDSLDNNTPYRSCSNNNLHNNTGNSHQYHQNSNNHADSPPSHDTLSNTTTTTTRSGGDDGSTPHTRSPNRPVLVADGQLHLRQVLHPKAAFHGIELPATYNSFFDLRKEFQVVYHHEVASVQDMANYLDLTMGTEENLGVKSTATMVKVVGRMAADGHVFQNPEQIFVKHELGITCKGEEVDSGCVVRARGLPWMSTEAEIAKFFRGLNVARGGVALCLSPQGRRNGEALIRFQCPDHRDMALRRHKHHMGGRYIEVYKATGEDFVSVAGGNNNEATQFLARGNLIIRMRGLPYDCTAKQVVDFFQSGENGVRLLDSEDGVLFVRKPDGRATGDAFALLSSDEDVTKALVKHRDLIGSRYIELFRSTPAEVMNRSMDIRHMDQQQQQHQPQPLPPLIAQLPALPPLLPQHSVAHGPKKDCVRLRGLPFEAGIEHVLEFLGEFAKSIIFRGVHMVYTPQGHPSGEAFIQMVNEQAAWACASGRHNRYMYFGKKHRYIEVFQCSGDDMNFVLSGANTSATGVGTPGAVPTAVSTPAAARSMVHTPGGSGMLSPYGAYPLGPAPTVIGHTLTPAPRLTPYPTQIHTAYPTMFYWPYPPSPPVSPTSGYYSSLHPHAIIPSECIPIHGPGELSMRPIEAVATM